MEKFFVEKRCLFVEGDLKNTLRLQVQVEYYFISVNLKSVTLQVQMFCPVVIRILNCM